MSCVVLEYKTRTNLDPNWGKTAMHTPPSPAQIREMRKDKEREQSLYSEN